MATGRDRANPGEIRDYVEAGLQELAPVFVRAGLTVTAVEVDTENGRRFPDLVVRLTSDTVEGERDLRYYLGRRGVLEDPGEVVRGLLVWALEDAHPGRIERLPRSHRRDGC